MINLLRKIKKTALQTVRSLALPSKLRHYMNNEMVDGKFKLILGGHWANNPGWLILDEVDQDITKPLRLPSDIADVVFTEHVIEHITLPQAISFLREIRRVLKPGGVVRIVSPMTETILSANWDSENDKTYIQNCLIDQTYPKEQKLLEEIGLHGIYDAPQVFMLNSLFREHYHKFIWSAKLMTKVLYALGFSEAAPRNIGEGFYPEYCIERRERGLYLVTDWEENMRPGRPTYDIESMIVEAKK